MTVNLFNIQHFSLHDGPGIRTTVFMKGCPLRCVWCHNPESQKTAPELAYMDHKCTHCQKCVEVCPQGVHAFEGGKHLLYREKCIACGACVESCVYGALELFGKVWTVEEVMKDLQKDDVFYDQEGGITFSGGEPFGQFDALYALLLACKEKGYHVCVETSGFTSKEHLKKAAPLVDCFLYDIKAPDEETHKKYTGVSNGPILENLSVLDEVGAKVMLRCPIIPEVNDREDHFAHIADLANSHPCVVGAELMGYHPLGISKALQIGEESGYSRSEFLDAKVVEDYAKTIQKWTQKPVSVSK